jgi:hypothetical protein
MTGDNYLFILILFLLTLTGYLVTINKMTDKERDEMLSEDDWF